jgi:hypothetical protein
MKTTPIPKQFSFLHRLGEVRRVFPHKHGIFTRLAALTVCILSLAAAAASLILGLLETYERYYLNGPAVLTKIVWGPILLFGLFLFVSVWAAWAAYSNWSRAAVLYEKGLAFSDLHGVQVWSWAEVTSIRCDITRTGILPSRSGSVHMYWLTGEGGRQLILDDRLENVDVLAGLILDQVTPRILKGSLLHFQNGDDLSFGPLQINRSQGLCISGKRHAWDQIRDITVKHGSILVDLEEGGKGRRTITVPAAKVPNLEVFFSLVDGAARADALTPGNMSSAANG